MVVAQRNKIRRKTTKQNKKEKIRSEIDHCITLVAEIWFYNGFLVSFIKLFSNMCEFVPQDRYWSKIDLNFMNSRIFSMKRVAGEFWSTHNENKPDSE